MLKLLSLLKNEKVASSNISTFPSITVLCPAYNEEKHIEAKIKSFLDLDYPKDKIKMIVISDDSTDKTNEIVQKYVDKFNIELVIQKPRRGKPSGHNLVEPEIKTDYILSTDANSIFHPDAIKKLVKKIQSDDNIGMVSGQLELIKEKSHESGEGIYWRYESFLKKLESKTLSLVGANGSLFLIKRELFTQIHPSSVDDFERALIVRENRKTVKYYPEAKVTEYVSEKPTHEIKRKIRIISREWFALFRHVSLLNPFKHFSTFFILLSHKIIRWLLPIFSLLILFSNMALVNKNNFYYIVFVLQLTVYLLGIIGFALEKNDKSSKITKLPTYWLSMNYSAFIALIKFILGNQQSTWKTQR